MFTFRINLESEKPLYEVGMFLVMIELPNGFTIDEDIARANNRDKAKLIELEGRSINAYFDTVSLKLYLNKY